jgi:mttA/Hcf106 family protein
MGSISIWHWLIVLVVVLVIFGTTGQTINGEAKKETPKV